MSVAQFDNEYEDYYIATTLAITYTKPKPPSGRQCLAGSWGNDTDRQVHYKVFSSSHFAPTTLSSDWILLFKCGFKNSHHENPTWDRTKL